MASVNDIEDIISELSYLNLLIRAHHELVSRILFSVKPRDRPDPDLETHDKVLENTVSGIVISLSAIVESQENMNWKLQRVLKIETALAASSN